AFGFEPPVFAHHCLILGKDHAKLSKRHGSVSVGEFRRKGYLPEALVNYLGLLGSSFADAREVLSLSEMVEAFSLERASKSGAVFDEEKLRWLNAIYIRSLTADDLMNRLWPFLRRAGYQPEKLEPRWMKQVIETVKDELTALADVGEHIEIFFEGRYRMTPEAKQILDSANAKKVVLAFGEYLDDAEGSPLEIYAAAIKQAREKSGVKGRDLFMPVRAALTGKVHGPELEKVFAILGKESAVKRLKQAYP
ncbi:MAG: glutamate--tRNA ligase family protein, partial [Smithellaceae bacterium]|nr:glutamate--tRNA ligase family protein [Smithellaceae bacterium]